MCASAITQTDRNQRANLAVHAFAFTYEFKNAAAHAGMRAGEIAPHTEICCGATFNNAYCQFGLELWRLRLGPEAS